MKWMRPPAMAAVAMSMVAAGWSCSSSSPSGVAPDSGVDAAEASVPDATPPPEVPAVAKGCTGTDPKRAFTSTFDGDAKPTLTGWTPEILGVTNDFVAFAGPAGGVGRGTVVNGTGPTHAVITRGDLAPSFAVQFSFAMATLDQTYVVHQVTEQTEHNLVLSLQSGGWELTAKDGGPALVVGPIGAAGAMHKIAYRVTPQAGGAHLDVIFDGQTTKTDLTTSSTLFKAIQLGPVWAPDGKKAPDASVDYDNVTVWDCTNK